jgi:hypothetical protein
MAKKMLSIMCGSFLFGTSPLKRLPETLHPPVTCMGPKSARVRGKDPVTRLADDPSKKYRDAVGGGAGGIGGP